MIMGIHRVTVEEVIQLRDNFEELRQLRNLKRNIELGFVVNISPELLRLLMFKDWSDL